MLRATARVHIACDGRSLGRILATVMATDVPPDDELDAAGAAEIRAPARSDSRVIRAVRLIGARLPTLLSPLALPGRAPSGGCARAGAARRRGPALRERLRRAHAGRRLRDRRSAATTCRRRRGPTSSPTRTAASWSPSAAAASPGPENSYFFRLTPWHNDPVSDPVSEVLYLRDEDTGELWCATPAPVRRTTPYTVRHGAGTSTFEHEQRGIATRSRSACAEDAAVKLVAAPGDQHAAPTPRRLTLTTYVEWTLGVLREHTQHQVHTAFDREQQARSSRRTSSTRSSPAGSRSTRMSEPVTAHTGEPARVPRPQRHGRRAARRSAADAALRAPPARASTPAPRCSARSSSRRARPARSPSCSAPRDGRGRRARALLAEYRDAGARARRPSSATVDGVDASGSRSSRCARRSPASTRCSTAGRSTRRSPAGCGRRSALYQSSGAYGFRDQLQDVMAFVYAEPALAREHILRAAGAPVRRGRRAALVASAERPRRAHPVLRRPGLAAVRRRPLRPRHRRRLGARRVRAVPHACAQLEPDEHEVYDLPAGHRRARQRLRALPPRAAARVHRRARTACR